MNYLVKCDTVIFIFCIYSLVPMIRTYNTNDGNGIKTHLVRCVLCDLNYHCIFFRSNFCPTNFNQQYHYDDSVV